MSVPLPHLAPPQTRQLTQREARQMFEAGLDSDCAVALKLPQGQKYLRRMATRKVREYFAEQIITYCLVQNVHLTALRMISEALGHPLKDANATAVDLAKLAVAAIKEKSAPDPMAGWEKSFAYERASGAIETSCVAEPHEDALENGWYDLNTSDEDLSDEVAYLESRRLIMRHLGKPNLVTICDEGEPLPLPAEKVGA